LATATPSNSATKTAFAVEDTHYRGTTQYQETQKVGIYNT